MSLTLAPASHFSLETLTEAYNQTRVDYIVPMPMNAVRLAEYIRVYDIKMAQSVVALDDDQILGISMLALRPGRSWITRLGVLPTSRRQGAGDAMMAYLLNQSKQAGRELCMLEVIHGNKPAHKLFLKHDFHKTRPLLILRRSPKQIDAPDCSLTWLDKDQAVRLLDHYPDSLAWTNQAETFLNTNDALGLRCELSQGSRGWMVFRKQKFYLSHFVIHTEEGNPINVAQALLRHVHQRFPHLDTHTENITSNDPHLPAFWDLGYVEAFHRIEMRRKHPSDSSVF